MPSTGRGKKQKPRSLPRLGLNPNSNPNQIQTPPREYPKQTKTLPPEFKSEAVDLGFLSLRFFYVDLAAHPYWTWAIGAFTGGEFTSKAAAKWDAAVRAYGLLHNALEVLQPSYDKAVKRDGLIEGGSD